MHADHDVIRRDTLLGSPIPVGQATRPTAHCDWAFDREEFERGFDHVTGIFQNNRSAIMIRNPFDQS
jgi:hypothetical protein